MIHSSKPQCFYPYVKYALLIVNIFWCLEGILGCEICYIQQPNVFQFDVESYSRLNSVQEA